MRVASTRKIHHEDNNKEVKKYYHLSLHTKQDKDDANGKAEQSDKVFNDDGIEVWWKCEVEGCEYDHGTILVSDKNKAQRKYAHKQRQKNDEVPDNPPMKEKSQEQSPAKKKSGRSGPRRSGTTTDSRTWRRWRTRSRSRRRLMVQSRRP